MQISYGININCCFTKFFKRRD